MNLYDLDINLEPTDPDEITTDVIVIARTVRHTDDGRLTDQIIISTTRNTTGMIQRGMIHEALDCLTEPEETL